MAYYNKIGLLALTPDKKKFLITAKGEDRPYLMPGGQIEDGETELECLHREIREELACDVDSASLKYINEYSDVSASHPDRDVDIKLYLGELVGEPVPSSEIKFMTWVGADNVNDDHVSPIIRHKIIPDLLEKNILHK